MKRILLAALFAAFLCGCKSELTPANPDKPILPQKELDSAIPGTAYLYFSEDAAARIEGGDYGFTKSGMGIRSLERIIPDGGEFDARHHAAGLHRWYTVKYDKLITATKASEGLSAMEGVMSVTLPREKILHSQNYFNDTFFKYQWNLFNDGTLLSSRGKGSYLEGCDINVIPVWENYTTGSKGVTVAVLDGAVNMNHEDFVNTVIAPGSKGSQCFVDGYEGTTLYPLLHGCNVSAIIGAASNNSYGVAGVAGGSDGNGGVALLSCAVTMTDPKDSESVLFASDDNIMKAFVYACDAGAVICNNSWGYVFDGDEDAREYSEAFAVAETPVRTGIDYFVEYAGFDKDGNQTGPMAGGLVVFSSGNDAFRYACPAGYDKVLAVAAHGSSFDFTDYSTYGDWVDLVAPGGADDPTETKEPYGMIIGPGTGSTYYYMTGTSQAAPHVSGVAALLVSYFGAPGFTVDKLWEYLLCGAKQNVLHGNMTGPMLDASGAFNYALGALEGVSIVTSYTGNYTIRSHETLTVDYKILGNDSKKLPVTVETSSEAISYRVADNVLNMEIDALKEEPGKYPVCIYVGKGTADETAKKYELTILPNHAPEIARQIPDTWSNVAARQDGAYVYDRVNLDLYEYFTDEDGETLSFEVTNEDESVVEVYSVSENLECVPIGYGSSQITVKASDARGETVSQTFIFVGRDTSREFDLYPNPVHDVLYVRAGSSRITNVELISATGATVLSKEATTSPSNPLKMDVSGLLPGSYVARITIAGRQMDDVVVVKI